jgi:hypothetical protein
MDSNVSFSVRQLKCGPLVAQRDPLAAKQPTDHSEIRPATDSRLGAKRRKYQFQHF